MKDEKKEKIFQDILANSYIEKLSKADREDFTCWLYDYIYQLNLEK